MGVGKYSPLCPNTRKGWEFFDRNAKGEIPPAFEKGQMIEEIHFANYDPDGFDSYGYSAYDSDGNYVGIGNGIDRAGKTEDDYREEYLEELRWQDRYSGE